jgi:uncharacterized membrane protein
MSKQGYVYFDPMDVQPNKVPAALAYVLFFLPLILCPSSPFGKYHANQGLLLFILASAGSIVLRLIPLFSSILQVLFSLVVFGLAVFGAVNALNGRAEPLPVIGHYTLLY